MLIIAFLVQLILSQALLAQTSDTTRTPGVSGNSAVEGLSTPGDTLTTDTLKTDTLRVRVSANAIQSEVKYFAEDSLVYNLRDRKVNLYKDAQVNYQKIELKAAFISYNFIDNNALSMGLTDTAGAVVGRPVFKDENQTYESDTIRYNFKTKKGAIKGVYSQMDSQGHIYGDLVKKDSNDVIWIKGGEFCPCEDKDAKTRIRVGRLKILPRDKIITGAGYLTLSRIPTPIAFPFGFFPNNNERSAGILIPQYGESPVQGFYLQNLGYYQPLSDHMDVTLTGDIYSKGSYSTRLNSRYNSIYKSQGAVELMYSLNRTSFRELSDYSETKSYGVKWDHRQDPKARPGTTFNASVNVISGQSYKRNLNINMSDFLSSTFNSAINYNKSWDTKPYNLSISAQHSQNTQTRDVVVSLPNATFAVSRVFLPLGFLKSNEFSSEQWFEKIGVNYTGNFLNRLNAKEYEIRADNLKALKEKLQNGVNHNTNFSTSIKAGFFNINPSFTYNERWYFRRLTGVVDEVTLQPVRNQGFYRNNDYNTTMNLSTQIYGMYSFRKGRVAAVRHLFSPSFSLRYNPEFLSEETRMTETGPVIFNPFSEGVFGSANMAESGGLSIDLNNSLEMKLRTPRDTANAFKKVKILEGFNLQSYYDVFKDSVRWSQIAFRTWTSPYKGVNLNYSANFDPYNYDNSGVSLNESLLKARGKLARMTTSTLSVTAGMGTVEPQNPTLRKKGEKLTLKHILPVGFPITTNVNYNISTSRRLTPEGVDTVEIVQTLGLTGQIQLLRRVGINYFTGYDFLLKEIAYTRLDFYFDLNCWEIGGSLIPIGYQKSYSIRVNMKSAILKDLKFQQQRTIGPSNALF